MKNTAFAFLCALTLLIAACGGDGDDTDKKNNATGCLSNSECVSGVCDLSTGQCQLPRNNTVNNNGSNNDNNSSNNDSNNATNNNGTNNNGTNGTTGTNNGTGGVCGDGTVDADETCDGNCPATCEDNDVCTSDVTTGTAAACDLACANDPITACVDDDGCCPAGCDETNDLDCSLCGNGVVDAPETCDSTIAAGTPGACPVTADCNDNVVCTTDLVQGSADQCSAVCQNTPITACVNNDGCCAPGCTPITDNDCVESPSGGACVDNTDCAGNANNDPGFCSLEWASGYCTVGCQVDADCAAGSHCTGTVCVADCTVDADCRTADGYECYDFFGDGTNTCAPALTTGDAPGSACADDTACFPGLVGGNCLTEAQNSIFTGGYCLTTCFDDTLCQDGSHCGFIDPQQGTGACIDSCVVDADCRGGYVCGDADEDGVDECYPGATGVGLPGATCVDGTTCAGGIDGSCITEANSPDFVGGYCTLSCTADADCGATNECVTFRDDQNVITTQFCADGCAIDADCRAGYLCRDADEDGANECWPSATGNGAVGDQCVAVQECAGGVDGACIDLPGGYCLISGCTAAAGCPAGSHCGFIDAVSGEGVCIDACAVDTDCRADGYLCTNWDGDAQNVQECQPSGTGNGVVGGTCDDVSDCAGGVNGICAADPDWPAGYCLIDCTPGSGAAVCPGASTCTDFGNGFNGCLDDCVADADCRTGYECIAGLNVCAPL